MQTQQNTQLVKNNVKQAARIRKLEEQIVSLQKELLENETNRVPLGHVQDVCHSALEEIENIEKAFNEKLNIFKNHARIGLEAITNLELTTNSKDSNESDKIDSVQRSKVKGKLGVISVNQRESPKAKLSKPRMEGKENAPQ